MPSGACADVLFSAPSKLHGERNEASVLFDAEAMGAPRRRSSPSAEAEGAPEHSAVIDLDALPRPRALRRPSLGMPISTSSGAFTMPRPRVVPGGAPFHPPRHSTLGLPSRALAVAGAAGFIGVMLLAALLLPV